MFRARRSLYILGFATLLVLLRVDHATAQTWTATSPGNLLTGSNWSGGSAPNGIGAIATISSQPTNAGEFTLNGSMTLGTVTSSNSLVRRIDGTGTLTM